MRKTSVKRLFKRIRDSVVFQKEWIWLETFSGFFFFVALIVIAYHFFLEKENVWTFVWTASILELLLLLGGFIGFFLFVFAGGHSKRFGNLLFLIEAGLVFAGVLYIGSLVIGDQSLFAELSDPNKIIIKVWGSLLLGLLLLFLLKALFRSDATVIFGWYFHRFYFAFFSVLMILLMIIVLFKSFEFMEAKIAFKKDTRSSSFTQSQETEKSSSAQLTPDKDQSDSTQPPPDYYVEVLGVLFTLIALGGGFATYLIQSRIQHVDRLQDMLNETKGIISTVVEMIITNLPTVTETQHIPLNSRYVLAEIDLLLKSSPHLLKFLEDEPEKWAKVWLARGVFLYTNGRSESIDVFEKIKKMKNQGKTIDDDTYGTALWRLGIAYRQFGMFKQSREIFQEVKENQPIEEYKKYGMIGEALTNLAELRNAGISKFWGLQGKMSQNLEQHLKDSMKSLADLWRNGHRDLFVSWYLITLAYELDNKDQISQEVINVAKCRLEEIMHTREDLAIRANFSQALAMLTKVESYCNKRMRGRNNHGKFANYCEDA